MLVLILALFSCFPPPVSHLINGQNSRGEIGSYSLCAHSALRPVEGPDVAGQGARPRDRAPNAPPLRDALAKHPGLLFLPVQRDPVPQRLGQDTFRGAERPPPRNHGGVPRRVVPADGGPGHRDSPLLEAAPPNPVLEDAYFDGRRKHPFNKSSVKFSFFNIFVIQFIIIIISYLPIQLNLI